MQADEAIEIAEQTKSEAPMRYIQQPTWSVPINSLLMWELPKSACVYLPWALEDSNRLRIAGSGGLADRIDDATATDRA